MAAVAAGSSGGMTPSPVVIRSREYYDQQKGKPAAAATPTASDQGQALLNPPPQTVTTPVNPMQATAFNRAADFESNLAKGTNEEITRELSRNRDEISAGMRAEGEAAMGRGADPSLFRARALSEGGRNLAGLQGKLADVALGRRQEAINAVTGAAGAAAGEERQMHLGTLAAQAEQQRVQNETASTQSRLWEAPYQRLLEQLRTQGGLLGGGVGITGGGVGGGSGAGMISSRWNAGHI